MYTDVLIIGSGIAGCITALELAERGVQVVLIGAGATGNESNSHAAQGGIIFRGLKDSEELLKEDILSAGCGLCNPHAVDQLIQRGPKLVQELLVDKYGVAFDRHEDSSLKITSEGAHSLPGSSIIAIRREKRSCLCCSKQ